ncbi:alanyl-tRNA synthetase [Histomonas meleagridis]|uniref:alanyl-tRNA synthetase n=1 Tax=Histomonas meleagridis TaxID=135588 RepID=UPI00355A5EFF|nr:alanyl-tRNA synthetase [Histomonas meleagridis]KAH0806424.1 alanyl-tRNA synthetase [Histomonas meleagridis]
MSPAKAAQKKDNGPVPLTPSEVKSKARVFFNQLMAEGKSPWPTKFLSSQGFTRLQCKKCHKYFWSSDPTRDNCGDSICAGGYSFINQENTNQKITYYQAWEDFQKSFTTTRVPHTVVPRYPVVARWRSDVDFVAAGIYCYQPFCVSGESEPPGNPLIQCQFCLRFNDLDNIGVTGRHYSGFNMLGIQVFNHADHTHPPQPPYDEIEEIYWKDSCIENNYRWCIETLHLKKDGLTFIEDVWQGGGNCGACVEFFYGGLEIGNMVFTEYAVSPDYKFTPIDTKVIDVGIGLERIPWLINGGWTSYIYVFDYMLPELSAKLGVPIDTEHFRQFAQYTALFDVDENDDVSGSWLKIGEKMGLNCPCEDDPNKTKLERFQEELKQFSDLIIICDHTRTCLFAIEDGALPSNVGGGGNIRNVLRRVFAILKKRNWLEKIGGVEGIIGLFKSHINGLKGFVPEFKNIRCLETVIKLEYERWTTGKVKSISMLKSLIDKKKGDKTLTINDWILAIESYGLDPAEISEFSGQQAPDDLWLKFDEHRIRTGKMLQQSQYDVSNLPATKELYNLPEYEHVYTHTAKVLKVINKKSFVCDSTILYPTGGGQQHDEGFITVKNVKYEISEIEKVRNVVIFIMKTDVDPNIEGEEAFQEVDKEVREILRVQHTATHVIAAAARRVLGPHVWQNGAKKTKYGAHIDLTHYELPSYEQLLEIDRVANELILSGSKVYKKVYSRKEAEGRWGFVLYQGGAIPGNAIRVVDINGIDTEACCGTHCDSLYEIGSVKIVQANKVADGVFRIEFVAGKLAIDSHHQDMRIIRNLQNLYGVSKEDLEKNCQRFFTERNSFMSQSKNLLVENLYLNVSLGLAKNNKKFIIKSTEQNATIYLSGLDNAIKDKKKEEVEGKSMMVLSNKFFYGLVTKEVADELKDAFKPLIDQKKIAPLKIDNNPKKPKPFGLVGFGSMKVNDDAAAAVSEIFKEHQFI